MWRSSRDGSVVCSTHGTFLERKRAKKRYRVCLRRLKRSVDRRFFNTNGPFPSPQEYTLI